MKKKEKKQKTDDLEKIRANEKKAMLITYIVIHAAIIHFVLAVIFGY